jgi:ArsR family transcriptional regulator
MLELFKALADETRLRILSQVLRNEMCVCEIEEALGLTQSNASRHLSVLKRAGILESYKMAQWTYYKMNKQFVADNRELYNYLVSEIARLPCYNADCENYQQCKLKDLCNDANIKGELVLE